MYAFRGPGSWYYEFRYRARRFRRGGFPTKRLAELAGEAERRELAEGRVDRVWGVRERIAADDHMPTLRQYVERAYVPHHLPRLAPSTQKTARYQVRQLLLVLGERRLDELGPTALDSYVARRLATVSANHVREEIERLSRIVNHARGRGVLAAHPFRGWKRPRARRRDIRIVTPAEEGALLKAAGPGFADWIVLALDTGLRKGELRTLEPGAVRGGALRLPQPKTGHVKVIPLTPRAEKICTERIRTLRGGRWLLGGPPGGTRPWSGPWVDRRWVEAGRGAGLKGIRFHDLRHTFATRALEVSGSIPEVGEMLGHKPPYTTTLRYVHALPEAKRRVIEALGRRYPPRTPPRRGRRP